MRDLVIIGAGGSSRDIIELVEDINGTRPSWTIRGVLDDDPAQHGAEICGVPVIGPIADAAAMDAALVIGIASSRNRRVKAAIAQRLGVEPARYATLIHPTASVSTRAAVGAGCVLLQHVVVGPQVTIGRHVLVCAGGTIGHDAVIGDHVSMAPHVAVSGGVRIASSVYLGSGARLREGITIGESSLVGIGAVVLKDVEPGRTVFGNPARDYL
jgi:sugar O-acyltransferase (sialic acid O-acetyltransferase NeuD family)